MTPDVSSHKAVPAHYKALISGPHSDRPHWSSYDSHRWAHFSTLSTPKTKRRGCCYVSPQSHGHSFNNPARQECARLHRCWCCLLSSPIVCRASSFLSSSDRALTVPSLCQQGALLPLNKMFCKHTRQRLCKAFCLSLAVGETESRASSMLDKSPAAESQSQSYLCFLWIPSWVGYLANSFNTLWASLF